MSALPPDRGGVATEARLGASGALDASSVEDCLRIINDEDARVAGAVRAVIGDVAAFVRDAEPGVRRGGRLVYVGAGTSGRLGVLDASECPPTFLTDPGRVVGIIAGGDAALRRSSESLEDDPDGARPELDALGLGPDDAVLGVTAGGTTPYVLGALDAAHGAGCVTGLLTCAEAPAGASIRHVIRPDTGPEALTGSTRMKAGTATKMVLNMVSTTLMVRLGKVYENLMVDVSATNDKLRDRAARTIAALTGVAREEAFALLEAGGGRVKTALLMRWTGLDRPGAEAALRDAGGDLRAARRSHE